MKLISICALLIGLLTLPNIASAISDTSPSESDSLKLDVRYRHIAFEDGTEFQFDSMISNNRVITILFTDSTYGGTNSCNRFGGSYSIHSPNVINGNFEFATQMYCFKPGKIENSKYQNLQSAIYLLDEATFGYSIDTLIINSPMGKATYIPE